jgi:hypothetical protein
MMEALAEGITSACLNGPLLGYPLMNVQAPPPLRPVCQLPSTACLPSLAKDALPPRPLITSLRTTRAFRFEWLPSAGADAQVRVEHIESETDVTVHLVQAAAPQPPTAARVRRTRIRSPFDVHPPQSNTMLAAHSSSSAAVQRTR